MALTQQQLDYYNLAIINAQIPIFNKQILQATLESQNITEETFLAVANEYSPGKITPMENHTPTPTPTPTPSPIPTPTPTPSPTPSPESFDNESYESLKNTTVSILLQVEELQNNLASVQSDIDILQNDINIANGADSSITEQLAALNELATYFNKNADLTPQESSPFYACTNDEEFGGVKYETPVAYPSLTLEGKIEASINCSKWALDPQADLYAFNGKICTPKLDSAAARSLCLTSLKISSSFYACNNDAEFEGVPYSTPVATSSITVNGKLDAIQKCSAWAFNPKGDLYGYEESCCSPKLTSGEAFNLCIQSVNIAKGTVNAQAPNRIFSCTTADDINETVTMGNVVASKESNDLSNYFNAVVSCSKLLKYGESGQFSNDGVTCSDNLNSGQAYDFCMSGLNFDLQEN